MGFVNPQKKRKIPTLKSFTPSESAYDMRLQTEYWAYLQELQNYIAQADGLDLNKIKLGTSLSDWLPMNLGDYFQVEAYHHRLHLEQAKRVMQNPQFPQWFLRLTFFWKKLKGFFLKLALIFGYFKLILFLRVDKHKVCLIISDSFGFWYRFFSF